MAVIALGAPSCAFLRRRKAPSALSDRCSEFAARRSAVAARFAARRAARASHLAACDFVVRTQTQPRGEVLGCRPLGHVYPRLAYHLERGVGVYPVYLAQVHSRHPMQPCAHVELRRVVLGALPAATGLRRLAVAAVLERRQQRLDLAITFGDLALIYPVQIVRLRQLEDVLRPPVAFERLGYRLLVRFGPGSPATARACEGLALRRGSRR